MWEERKEETIYDFNNCFVTFKINFILNLPLVVAF